MLLFIRGSSLQDPKVNVLHRLACAEVCLSDLARSVSQNFPRPAAETLANPFKGVQLQVLLAALYGAVIGPMHANVVSKALLAVLSCYTSLTQRCA